MQEPGLDEHEWESEWQSLEPLVEDSPAEALPELDGLIERMMVERGYPIEESGTAESAEPEVLAEFLEARRIARLADAGETVDPGDVAAAVNAYRGLYDHLLGRTSGI